MTNIMFEALFVFFVARFLRIVRSFYFIYCCDRARKHAISDLLVVVSKVEISFDRRYIYILDRIKNSNTKIVKY